MDEAELLSKLADINRRRREIEAERATTAAVTTDAALAETCKRLEAHAEECRKFSALHKKWADNQPQTITCSMHKTARAINWERSQRRSWEENKMVLVYKPCAECVKASKAQNRDPWLAKSGVPQNLIHCSFDGFRAETEEEKENLETAKKFVRARQGFLVLLGPLEVDKLGNGKSHISVAVLRDSGLGIFVTVLNLFNRVRRDFESRSRIIDRCKSTKLLVLDEFGLSNGYADELPIIHDILSHRHGEKLKTIITGNFATKEEFLTAIGPRMASRLQESGFKLCWFTGDSKRPQMKQAYFDEQEISPAG